ncbi:serine protease, S1-C subfamily, contains C-terminal PDZ domain [Halobiforma haloterrestris]|uniref:Serine protease, S1-C subfamily, contains C-terminal PDZ domain n=1 Tax=Natronobacterium haloterrestre TaxID=148448 RepID=A0A1I1K4T5_NATHA|nr:trypsin-like peptidase domain-containing protein [Halobiforma haloterrestris]SFC55242.1 serine protease, S1-C subfamily, contains C-terminal PDZ domain [Halobiforma haloterrestris]
MSGTPASTITRRTALEGLAGLVAVGSDSGVVGGNRETGIQEQSDEDDGSAAGCDYGRVFEDVIDSVVTVRVFDREEAEIVQGSGWVYDRENGGATVLTNWHVVFLGVGADVRFSGGDWRAVDAPLGFDPFSDLAILRVEDVPENVEALSLAEEPPDPGDRVAAFGAPLGLEETITTGTVSGVGRSTTVQFEQFAYTVPSTIQTDAAINPGNSGGPLVDCAGDVVGVNFAGTPPLLAESVNFAVAASMIERIVPEIEEFGAFRYPYLGIQGITLSPTVSRLNGFDERADGVYVERTVDGFPADEHLQGSTAIDRETGVPIGGDAVVGVDDVDVSDLDDLRNVLFHETRPDDTVGLEVLRDGDREEIDVTLAAKPFELERIGVREPTL